MPSGLIYILVKWGVSGGHFMLLLQTNGSSYLLHMGGGCGNFLLSLPKAG